MVTKNSINTTIAQLKSDFSLDKPAYKLGLDIEDIKTVGLQECELVVRGEKGQPLFMVITFSCSSNILTDDLEKNLKGLSTKGYDIDVLRKSKQQFDLEISLDYSEGQDICTMLLMSLFDDVAASPSTSFLKTAYALLERWKKYFQDKKRSKRLTPEEQRGLIGELHVLNRLLMNNNIEVDSALQCWRGPMGESQDFKHGGNALEIKTSLEGATEVHISSLLQLDTSNTNISLLRLGLHEDALGHTLYGTIQLVKSCIEDAIIRGDADNDDMKGFENRLKAVGYKEKDAEIYNETKYVFGHERCFEVKNGFPRLTRGELHSALGVDGYTLNLEDEDALQFLLGEEVKLEELLGY
ncbi:PD-(D/E)XK motif protein [Planctomycetota bacterium]|nr:PD-(D/E)XK motif protein [Planctomycetota bacterium]